MTDKQVNILTTGLSAFGSLGSSVANAIAQKRSQERTARENKELAEYQYSKDLEMWNRANEYNSPSSQMERLKAAGLNPNLVYGSGAAQSTAAQLPKYQSPRVEYNMRPAVDPLQMIGAYQDFRLKQAQIQTAEAEATNRIPMLQGKMGLLKEQTMGTKYKGWQAAALAAIMGNNYDAFEGVPTPWQGYQMDILKEQARAGSEKNRNIIQQRIKMQADTKMQQLNIDNYLTKMWSNIIGKGLNFIKR